MGGPHLHRFTALGGPCALHVYAADEPAAAQAAAAGEAEVRRIESKYSRYRADSVVGRINAASGDARGVEVDDETAGLLDYAATAHAQSGGRFDITSGVLRKAWDFKAARVPSQSEIDALLPLVGWERITWQRPRLVLPLPGQELDFGGFGKEYAADRVATLLAGRGIRHALVDLSGDLCVVGPHPDGAPWQVGIQHPRADGPIARVPLAHGAIATSGDYERGFERDGLRYCHLLDPRSGWPVRGLASVSVLAPQCLVAGTASTVAMLLGAVDGPRWLTQLGLPHLVVDAHLRLGGSIAAASGPEPRADRRA